MTLTTASDPAAWCHAQIDDEELADTCIEETLAGTDDGAPDPNPGRLLEAVEALESDLSLAPSRVRVHNLREYVLDAWEMAEEVDPDVAGTLESLLGRLTGTTRVSQGAVLASLEEARHQLLESGSRRR